MRSLTISITARNRPERLLACLRSLVHIAPFIERVLVLDDASEPPLTAALPNDLRIPIEVLREEVKIGFILGRNKIARQADTEFVFNLDDDTVLLDSLGVKLALEALRHDLSIMAVAFAQSDLDGHLYQAGYQPAPVDYVCQVPCFTGYGYIVRRELFLSIGGFRELLELYGEEKEFGLRTLDAGYKIIYLPEAKVAHLHDTSGRDHTVGLRYGTQSSCLQLVCNRPLILAVPGILYKLFNYHKIERQMSLHDPGGLAWVVRRIWSRLPAALRERKPVKWATLRRWGSLRKAPPHYRSPVLVSADAL